MLKIFIESDWFESSAVVCVQMWSYVELQIGIWMNFVTMGFRKETWFWLCPSVSCHLPDQRFTL
jgi:hypothetical protein